jgi:ectoine hydroxylase-related dioxygenase (phytanoyl-CoA dioxygenase family)
MTLLGRDIAVVSNGEPLSTEAHRLGRLAPTDHRQNRDDLWEQYQAQGYLWLKGILDRDAVLAFRRRFFTAFIEAGLPLIAAGTDPVAGIYDAAAALTDPGLYHRVLMEITRWAEYEAFCLMEPIRRFYETFLQGAPYIHKRKLIRYGKPGDRQCTGAHYDLIYLRGGTDNICTSWIPIGDVPVECGGLVYLEGSVRWGRATEAEFSARNRDLQPEERISAYNKNMKTGWLTNNLAALAEKLDLRWLAADYEAGDMVVHSPYMVHASTMNVDPERRIRLSTDIRYQRVRDEIDARWSNHLSLDDML